jgi:hypothetical protein
MQGSASARGIQLGRIHKFFHKRVGVPQSILGPVLGGVIAASQPGEWRRRRRLVASCGAGLDVPRADGYRRFVADELPGAAEAVETCQRIFQGVSQQRRDECAARAGKKLFLIELLSDEECLEQPDLARFVLSHPVLDTAARYLGSVPLLAGVGLCWSPPNQSELSSQLYHYDPQDRSQLKLLLHVLDTGEASGPFTFLPAGVSARVEKALGSIAKRVADDAVFSVAERSEEQRLVGPAGSGAFMDVSRCLHYGSRGNREERLVLSVQFIRFDAPLGPRMRPSPRLAAELAEGLGLDPVQRLALG